jgi:cell division protein FtsI (penicillin-binding protein 3)
MINSRALIIIFIVLLIFASLVYKLVDIQIIKSEELKYFAERQQTSIEKIMPERGMIYDRNNLLLVYNRSDISFFVDLRMVSSADKEKIADRFSTIFNKSKDHYRNLLNQSGKTICIEKKAPAEKAILLKTLKVTGLFYSEDPTRVYHYNSLASHILGYVDDTYSGVSGIEKAVDKKLTGVEGRRLIEKNAIGDMITVAEQETKPAVPGDNIYLTINKTFQSILEEELKNGLSTYGGTSALGILMDPSTGEVLALSTMNDFNPNEYWKSNDTLRRNQLLTDTYEPGSTFKAITMAALLDQKLCYADELINTENGVYYFKNTRITDTHGSSSMTVKKVFEQSSNVGVAKLVQRIDDDLFYKYLRGFGFGNFTSINLPGEAKGSLKKPTEWNPLTKPFISFGYEIAVTPIQLASAYSALVNGGILYQPQIIKKVANKNNGTVEEIEPKMIRRVISEETSAKMRDFLSAVVENGTGKNARLKEISVGGKTGTSQKLINGRYSKSHYNSSFAGFYPVNNPKVVCVILVNSPQNGKYGGAVAAPIFKRIAQRLVTSNYKYFYSPQETDQLPAEFKVLHTANSIEKTEIQNNKHISDLSVVKNGLMPDLTGHTLRDAIFILNELNIKYKVSGSGIVSSQSIPPGEKLNNKLVCKLDCIETEVNGTVIY